jgi:hypothetical protein
MSRLDSEARPKRWVGRIRNSIGRRGLVKGALAAAGVLLARDYAESASASSSRAVGGGKNALVCITRCRFGPNEFNIAYEVMTDVGVQLADDIFVRDLSGSAEQLNRIVIDDAVRRLAEIGVIIGPDDNIRLMGGAS